MTITTFRKMAFRRWFGMALIFMMIPAFSIAAYAETGVNVAAHTQDEIRNYINQNGPKYVATSFAKEPDKTDDGYHMGDQGALSTETMQDGLKMLNAIRYIAGLSADVSLDDDYTNQAQAGAFINDINQVMDHTPAKPEGMDEDLYSLGYAGTRSSNLSWASFIRPLANITLGWMSDETGNNLTTLGHRRWQINPKLKKVGFGQSGYFTAIRVHDTSGTGQETGVVWPARNMPVDFFSDNLPWSYSLGSTISDASVQLELIRGGEKKKTWSFHTKSSEPVNSGFYYNIDNDNYGQKGCIIFRPDNVSYHAGDSFKVTISGGVNAEYTVNFFALVPVESFTKTSHTSNGICSLKTQ